MSTPRTERTVRNGDVADVPPPDLGVFQAELDPLARDTTGFVCTDHSAFFDSREDSMRTKECCGRIMGESG